MNVKLSFVLMYNRLEFIEREDLCMNNEIRIFCNNIKALRQQNKLTKVKMCKILRISTRSLNMIENGILPPKISCEVLIRACRYFSIFPKDILSENIAEIKDD